MDDKISRKKLLEFIDNEVSSLTRYNVHSFREKMIIRGHIQALADIKYILSCSAIGEKFDYKEDEESVD